MSNNDCPENKVTFQHGPTNTLGNCPWCGQKMSPKPRPKLSTQFLSLEIGHRFYQEDHPKTINLGVGEPCACGQPVESCECDT